MSTFYPFNVTENGDTTLSYYPKLELGFECITCSNTFRRSTRSGMCKRRKDKLEMLKECKNNEVEAADDRM